MRQVVSNQACQMFFYLPFSVAYWTKIWDHKREHDIDPAAWLCYQYIHKGSTKQSTMVFIKIVEG